jgi:suppressor for copper-sensitivity B
LILGAFPEMLRFLPKPGEWMEAFKQAMGFVLMGTVVYLLTFIPWACVVPTVGLLFGIWAACWWVGRVPPTADFQTKLWRWAQAVLFAAAVGGVMFPGIDGIVEGRFAFGGLRETMQSRFDDAVSGAGKLFTTARFRQAIAARKTVVVDFTADWCLTCKTLEAQVLGAPEVRQALDVDGIVLFKADWTHRDPEVTAMLDALGSNAVPVIAIFPAADPNRPIVFRDGYTQEGLLAALKAAGP